MGWRQANEITDWNRSEKMTEADEKNGKVYCPTAEEIEERAAALRKKWDKRRLNKQRAVALGIVPVDFERDMISTDRLIGREGVIDNHVDQYWD